MMQAPDRAKPFLAILTDAATEAQQEEIAFRDNVAREIEKRERARQYAFRRLSLAELMLKVARGAADEAAAVAMQTAAFRAEFGWHGESDAHKKILAAWRPVALTVWDIARPPVEGGEDDVAASPPDLVAALAEFERWYQAEFGTNYLAILDQEKQEYPVVEF